MGHYNYKDTVHREDFQEAVKEWEKDYNGGEECDCDPNYDGQYWCVADYLLSKKDEEIRELKERIEWLKPS